ncbi:MAG: hypothetical protein Q7Q71_03145 [Verrucomicrobiota bacterium JB023]|nr:hypothetical protein [Verrucomicrobiota bacterium JB023]
MRYLPIVAGSLLGIAFFAFGLMFLLDLVPEQSEQPAPPEDSPVALFMGAMLPTGYLTFVKVLEVLGGLLVALPRTRNLGLLILGPILVNIIAFNLFIVGGESVFDPLLIILSLLAVYLLWVERRAFAALLLRPSLK